MNICDFLTEDRILAALTAPAKDGAIAALAALVAQSEPQIDRLVLDRALRDREQQASTAVGEGVAVPHARFEGLTQSVAAFARSAEGIDFGSLDGKPTHFVFLLVSPAEAPGPHLKILARVSRLLTDPQFRARSMQAADPAELFAIFRDEDVRAQSRLRAA